MIRYHLCDDTGQSVGKKNDDEKIDEDNVMDVVSNDRLEEETEEITINTCLFLPSNRPHMARYFHVTGTDKWGATFHLHLQILNLKLGGVVEV